MLTSRLMGGFENRVQQADGSVAMRLLTPESRCTRIQPCVVQQAAAVP